MYRILIIDDDEAIGNLEQEVLERAGYEVQRAFSGTEVLLLLKQQRPDMILLDLMLPGISGEELLSQIQNIPVIVVSAKTGVDDKVGLLLGGAVDYMTKPFETKELLASVAVRLKEHSCLVTADIYTYGELTLFLQNG
jgi:two-component system OmpR family response regulator